MSVYIGVDPGQTGAMAIIGPHSLIQIYDFEDAKGLIYLLENCGKYSTRAIIEKVSAMPKQGVSSSFNFGANFGRWIGRFEALEIPLEFVTPVKWKKTMFDSMPKGDVKAMSIDRARRLFPQMAKELSRKKDHSRAEALLLAEYLRRISV